jgi:AcrR family transcriptional regulator
MAPRRPSQELKARRESEILEAAAAVFAERGFRGTRIADVAARAGLGKGTIYEYYRSKEDLFLNLFHWYTDQAFASMTTTAEATDGSAVDALRNACDSLLMSCREMQHLYPLTMEFWSASAAPEFRKRLTEEFRRLYHRFRGAVAETIRAGIAQGEMGRHVDPDAVAAAIVGALDGIILQAWFDRDFDPVATGRHFLDVLVAGIAAGTP